MLPLSDNSLFAEYGMVDVLWKAQGSGYSTPPDAAITGAGSYTVGGEFAVQQRMEAELQVADEPPAPFDSGLVVGGGGFPTEIDVEISKNGKVCFDTVMHVVAQAQTSQQRDLQRDRRGPVSVREQLSELSESAGVPAATSRRVFQPTPEACPRAIRSRVRVRRYDLRDVSEAERARRLRSQLRGACCAADAELRVRQRDSDGVPAAGE